MDKTKRLFTVSIFVLILFLFRSAMASPTNPKNIFQAEPGFRGTHFQISSDGERAYFNDKGVIYSISIKDPKQERRFICEIPYPKTIASLIEFSISPDEKNLAYRLNEGNLVVLEIASGKKQTYERCSSMAWSNIVLKQLYFSYSKSLENRKYNGAIDVLRLDSMERRNVLEKNDSITICQVLTADDIVYEHGQEFRLYEQETGNDRLLFKNNKIEGKGTGGFSENKFKLSPDKRWAVVSFNFSPWEGIWLVRLQDAKACRVFRTSSGIGEQIEDFGFQSDWDKKQLYLALANYRAGFRLGEDWGIIIPQREYPTQIYILSLEKAIECFEKNKNLKDFSDCFNVFKNE